MDVWLIGIKHEASGATSSLQPRRLYRPASAPSLSSLPSELAFWALWHCRHARPPDSCMSR
ncbi:hypothetical protein [Pseudomonas farris]